MSEFYNQKPVGWNRNRIRFLMKGCKNGAWGNEFGEDGVDAICIRVADFDWDRLSISLEKQTVRSFPAEKLNKLALQKGDLLIEKSGGGEKTPVGRIVAYNHESLAVTSNFVARIRPNRYVVSRFLLYLLASQYMSGYSQKFVKQNTGIQNLDDTAWFANKVWLPDLETQKTIADFLDRETTKLDDLKNKTNESVDRLREFRSALITSAVTGQIDVTTWIQRDSTDRRLDRIEEEMSA